MNLTLNQRLFYGLGGGVNAVKTDFFVFYLGFYYLTVVGLNPLLTGLALFIALLIDAITDPLIGGISDRLSTRFGKRHYLMLISLAPIFISYLLLFLPINIWVDQQIFLFFWLLCFSTLTRFSVTLFDIPHRALAVELPDSYEDKTKIMSLREGFQALIALSHSFLLLPILYPSLRSNADTSEWFNVGLLGATMMVIFGFMSFFGTLKIIPHLQQIDDNKKFKPNKINDIFSDLSFIFKSKTLLIFLFGSLLIQAGWGLANSLTFLTQVKFWNLDALQIQKFIYIYFLAVFFSWFVTPKIIKTLDKHHLVILSLFVVGLFLSIPYLGYLAKIAPEEGSSNLISYLGFCMFFTSTFAYVSLMARESMVPDIVDEISKSSEFRRDGSVSAITSFCAKCMSGLGQFFSMFILWLIGFPEGGVNPSLEQRELLAFFQGPFIFILFLMPIYIFSKYPLTRNIHRKLKEQNL